MRRFRSALLALPVVALPFFVACEDGNNSSSSGGFTVPEGGGFEAGPPSEAGPVAEGGTDASIDTFVPPKGAKVTVTKNGAAAADIRVIAHDATGAVTGDVKTNATGVANFATAPSMITVLTRSYGTSPAAITYMGVADGDALNVVVPDYGPEDGTFATFQASVNPFVGALSYSFSVGGNNCGAFAPGNAPAATNISLYPYCLKAQNAVLVSANGDGSTLGFGFLKNQAKPAAAATVALPAMTLAAKGTLTLSATNIPADTFQDAQLSSIANGAGFYTGDRNGALNEGGFTFDMATGFAEALQTIVVATKNQGPAIGKAFLRREASNNTAAQTMAFDFATALPFITNAVAGGAVPARAEVTIAADGSLATTDGGIVRLRWNVAGGAIPQPSWSFVVPPGTTSLKVPALPTDADAAPYLPQTGVTVKDVFFLESTLLPGYAQAMATPLSSDGEPPVGTDVHTPLPLNGTVKITVWNRYLILIPG